MVIMHVVVKFVDSEMLQNGQVAPEQFRAIFCVNCQREMGTFFWVAKTRSKMGVSWSSVVTLVLGMILHMIYDITWCVMLTTWNKASKHGDVLRMHGA